MARPLEELEELDRLELTEDARAFGSWLYRWKRRWLAGERIRVLVALDSSHAIVVRDEDARRPGYVPANVQLELEL